MGPFIRATSLGRRRRSLLLAYRIAERIDDRCVSSGLGRAWYTSDPLRTAEHWRVVRILRSNDVVGRRVDSLRHVATSVAGIADTNRRRARGWCVTGVVWPHMCLLRVIALRLRRLYCRHGAWLAAQSVGIGILNRAWPPRCWNRHHGRHSPPSRGHPRSHHDELVRPSSLGAQFFCAAPPPTGDAAPKSMVRTRREPGVGRLRMRCRNLFEKAPLGLRLAGVLNVRYSRRLYFHPCQAWARVCSRIA